jgi:hypothetical protein
LARIRSIKPQFFLNEDVAALPYEWRLLFVGLWTQADRAGRLEDRPKRLKAALFPYDDLDIDHGLGCLANAGLIIRYEVNTQRLITIPTWGKHQQPHIKEADSDLPAHCDQEHGSDTVPAHRIREGKDQGMDQGAVSTALRARFERFWLAYPRKVAKEAAWKVWERLKPSDELAGVMVDAVRRQQDSPQWRRENGQFIPHPRTWLNQGRWDDEAESVGVVGDGMDGLRRFANG